MKISDKFTIRLPLLPLSIAEKLLRISEEKYEIYINELLNKHSEIREFNKFELQKSVKYFQRLSYRTTEYKGFSNVIVSFNEQKEINLKNSNKIFRNLKKQKITKEYSISLNELVIKKREYYKIFYEDSKILLSRNRILNYIYKNFKSKIMIKDCINIISEKFDLTIKEAYKLIYKLLRIEFLVKDNYKIFYNEKREESVEEEEENKFKVIRRKKEGSDYLIRFKKEIKNIEKVSKYISSLYKYENLNHLIDYFLENYDNSKVPLMTVISDKKILSLINNIKVTLNKKSKNYQNLEYLIFKAIKTQNRIMYIDKLNIEDEKILEKGFDIFVNLINLEGKNKILIDNGHNIVPLGDANLSWNNYEKNSMVQIGYYFHDSIKNIFYEKIENINFLNISNDINLRKYYVEYDKFLNEIFISDGKKKIIFSKTTMLNIEYFPENIKAIYFLSNILNKTIPCDINYELNFGCYLPRIIYENVIINRETWILYNKEVKNFKEFKALILDYFNLYNMEEEVCLCKREEEQFINIKKSLKKLYSIFLRDKILIFKEALQRNSIIEKEGEKYINDFIISLEPIKKLKYKNKALKAKKIYKVQPFSDWIFLECLFEDFEYEKWKFLIKFLSFSKKNNISFFFLNYMYEEEYSLRIRIKNENIKLVEKIFFFLNKDKIYYIILPYFQETNRYRKIGIKNFEEISIIDSECVIEIKKIFQEEILFHVCVDYLFHFLKKFEINIIFKIFDKPLKTEYEIMDINEFDKKNKKYLMILKSRDLKLKKYIKMLSDEKILKDMLHLTINRFLGINKEIENLVLKKLKLKIMEKHFRKYNKKEERKNEVWV